jgi:hypothetical protein
MDGKMILEIKHSGQLGDIVYAMPAMMTLAKRLDREKIRLFVPKNKIAQRPAGLKHTAGEFMISDAMFAYIRPLLESQPCFAEVISVEERSIPASAIDFDIIRGGALNVSAGNIKDYYFKAFGLLSESKGPWISPGFAGRRAGNFDVVIGRSTRYLNDCINYGIIDQLSLRTAFIGVEREFDDFMSRHKNMNIEYVPTSDALAACNLIASAPLYIGNQSFFFAIAEALQVSRLLEVFEPVPNVVPSGGKFGQFITTHGLGTLAGAAFSHPVVIPNEAANFARNFVLSV